MSEWKSFLKNNTLEWLLEENNPSVRYFTLIDLLDKNKNSAEVKEAKLKIMTEGSIPIILNKQKPGGYWGEGLSTFYLPKFRATFWTLFTLALLAADGEDKRIRQTCEYVIEHSLHKDCGAFTFPHKDGREHILPCLTGILHFSLIRFGLLDDPRVQRGIDFIVKYQRFDDGDGNEPRGWPYNTGNQKGKSCWGRHTCHDGVIGCLLALSEIPKTRRTKEIEFILKQASEHMLKHHIYKRSHDLGKISIPNWLNLGLPFNSDFLGVLLLLADLGYKDRRMQDALDLLLSKQNENGRWVMEKNYYRKLHTEIERKGQESKWITLRALTALKYFYS
jgi:hypothetical protein